MSERRPFPLHTGIATVAAVVEETEAMRRLTLTAPAFADPGVEQPGEILTLGWPGDGEDLLLPERGWRFRGGREQHWRNFTVRRAAPERAALDVEFFLHGDGGVAAAWGQRARVGDRVGFAGPRTHWVPDPAAEWTLLLADETGLPALLSIAEALPAGAPTIAIAEVADERERREPCCAAAVEWHWCLRGERAPGTTELLLEAVRELELPAGRGQAWGGGEALVMRDLRRHLATVPALADSLGLLGYWRLDTTPWDID